MRPAGSFVKGAAVASTVLGGLRNGVRALLRRLRSAPPRSPLTVLVTGATTGIGLALSRQLLATPHALVLTARKESLDRFAREKIEPSYRVIIRPLDVTNAEERNAVVAEAGERFGGVDVLVNNAGVCYRSALEHLTEEDRFAQMDVNFLGPMALARLVVPGMRERRFGRIINVSSLCGMTAMPLMGVYSASKFALEGASEAIWYELKPWGINVTLVQPGFLRSDGFTKVVLTQAGRAASDDPQDAYHHHYRNMAQMTESLMNLTFHTPEDVARTIMRVIRARNPPLRVAATLDTFLLGLFWRLLPARLCHRLLYALLPNVWEWGDADPAAPRALPSEEQLSRTDGEPAEKEPRAGRSG